MKIKHLMVENLTSLKGRHEVDFQKDLSGADLFAITGPTGSGKSSLLNAVSLALYARSAKTELSSQDFIAMGTGKASVKLEFYHMKDLYLATWSCRTVGVNGKLLKRPQVKRDFFFYDAKTQDWQALEKSAEEVLQLSYEQFTRSVVLNQGEFARFLTSSFAERRQILERLYSGENLQSLKTLLNDKLKKTQSEKELLDQQGQGLMPFSEEHYKELKLQRENLAAEEEQTSHSLELSKKLINEFDRLWDVLDQYQKTQTKLNSQVKLFDEQTQEVNHYKRQKQHAYQAHESLAQSYKKVRPILERVQELAQEHNRVAEKLKEGAQRKKVLENSLLQKGLQLKESENQTQQTQRELTKLKGELPEKLQTKSPEQQKQTQTELQLFLKVAPELKNTYNSQEQRIKHAQKELDLKIKEREDLKRQKQKAQAKALELEKSYSKEVAPFQSVEEIEEQKQQITLDLKEVEQRSSITQEHEKTLSETKKELQELAQKTKTLQNKLQEFDEQMAQIQEWKKLNELQASLESCIKKSLEEGECFVCGAEVTQKILEHPLLKNNYSPDLNRLDKLTQQRQQTQQLLDQTLFKRKAYEDKAQELHKQIHEHQDFVAAISKKWILTDQKTPFKKQLEHQKLQLEKKAHSAQKVRQERDQEQLKITYAQDSLEQSEQAIKQRQTELAGLEKVLKQTRQKMTEEKQKIQSLELPESFTIENYESLCSTLKDIQNQEHNKKQLHHHQQQIQQDLKTLNQQLQEEQQQQKAFEARLHELLKTYREEEAKAQLDSSFDPDSDADSPCAQRAREKILEYEKDLEGQQEKLNEYTQLLQNVELQQNQTRGQMSLQKERLKDLGELFTLHKMNFIKWLRPLKEGHQALEMKENWEDKFQNLEIDQISEEQRDALKAFSDDKLHIFFEQTELKHNQTKEKLQELKAQIELYDSKQNQKAELLKKAEEVSRKLKGLQKLHSLIGRDEFRNFALAMIERDLIQQTNLELEKICQGRYRIDFSITSQAQEFSLIDYWQGAQQRKISTLSGGETFLVSLAMALSLAEMSRGETEINSFFIDEGFGSLDQDSLEEVIETLSHIRSRGKQIGIISHVKELTQRIDVNIDLIKNQHGESHIQVLHN